MRRLCTIARTLEATDTGAVPLLLILLICTMSLPFRFAFRVLERSRTLVFAPITIKPVYGCVSRTAGPTNQSGMRQGAFPENESQKK
jgi:hypothetical protein